MSVKAFVGREPDAAKAAALEYAADGWPVFPLRGKVPRTPRGFKDASTNPELVAGWWAGSPDADVGIRTGAELVVVDIDPRHGGEETFRELVSDHGVPETTVVSTGGGGSHLYFTPPPGVTVPSRKLGPGVDLKAEGGYVVGPPSVHPETGRRYRFAARHEIAELPSFLLDTEHRRNGSAPPVGDAIPEGQRNEALASLAGSMRRRGMGEAEILAALRETNKRRCQPVLPGEEVERIARSVGRYAPHDPPFEPGMPRAAVPEVPSRDAAEAGDREGREVEPLEALDLDAFLASPPPEPDWEWRGWYARGDLVLAAGDPGVGKSLVALASSVAAAAGGGGELLGEAIAARRVLFIDLESPEDVAYARLYGFGLRGATDGFAYVHRPPGFNLLDAECLARLRVSIAETGAGLVVIDSLRRAAPGLDENDSREVSILLTALRDIAAALGCTILVIHHPRKPVGDSKVEALYAARGSGDLIGSVDSYLFFRKLSGGLTRVEHGKARRGREHEPVCYRILEGDVGEPVIEHVEGEAGPEDDELLEAVVRYVREHPGEPQTTIESEVTGSRKRVRTALERGASQNLLAPGPGRAHNGRYWYPADHAAFGSPGDHGASEGDQLFGGTADGPLAPLARPPERAGEQTGEQAGSPGKQLVEPAAQHPAGGERPEGGAS